jgi:hypothetical protein
LLTTHIESGSHVIKPNRAFLYVAAPVQFQDSLFDNSSGTDKVTSFLPNEGIPDIRWNPS